jgi:hypothetical protein
MVAVMNDKSFKLKKFIIIKFKFNFTRDIDTRQILKSHNADPDVFLVYHEHSTKSYV